MIYGFGLFCDFLMGVISVKFSSMSFKNSKIVLSYVNVISVGSIYFNNLLMSQIWTLEKSCSILLIYSTFSFISGIFPHFPPAPYLILGRRTKLIIFLITSEIPFIMK